MEQLRRRQLLHPDLVTEGMNRLAQALIILTDPLGKAAYDAKLGIPTAPPTVAPTPVRAGQAPSPPTSDRAEPLVVGETVFDDDLPPATPDTGEGTQEIVAAGSADGRSATPEGEGRGPQITRPSEPSRQEPVDAAPIVGYEVLSLDSASTPAPSSLSIEPDEAVVEGVRIGPTIAVGPTARRWIYARLAILRRTIRAWERLGVVLGDPQDPVDRPSRVLLLLEAVWAVRPLLPHIRGLVGGVGEPGGAVAAVVRHPLMLDTFRRLLPTQRQTIAIDWRRGQTELQQEYARLRRLARAGREGRTGTRGRLALLRRVTETPELILLLLAGVALGIAYFRNLVGR